MPFRAFRSWRQLTEAGHERAAQPVLFGQQVLPLCCIPQLQMAQETMPRPLAYVSDGAFPKKFWQGCSGTWFGRPDRPMCLNTFGGMQDDTYAKLPSLPHPFPGTKTENMHKRMGPCRRRHQKHPTPSNLHSALFCKTGKNRKPYPCQLSLIPRQPFKPHLSGCPFFEHLPGHPALLPGARSESVVHCFERTCQNEGLSERHGKQELWTPRAIRIAIVQQ